MIVPLPKLLLVFQKLPPPKPCSPVYCQHFHWHWHFTCHWSWKEMVSLMQIFCLPASRYWGFYYSHQGYFHNISYLHSNTYLLYCSVLLLPHVAACTDRNSTPSSIFDGASPILVIDYYSSFLESVGCIRNAKPLYTPFFFTSFPAWRIAV